MHITGSCHCGKITYEAEIDPADVRVCHCTDCQKLSGTAFRIAAHAPADHFKIQGSPKIYVKVAASGNRRAQAFCPDCGSAIYAADVENPRFYGIRLGTCHQRAELVPSRQIWCRSALPWLAGLDAGVRHEGQP